MKNNNIEREFVDERGDKSTIVIEEQNSYNTNLKRGHYKLSETMRPKNNSLIKRHHENILNADIGIRSSGFAGVAALSAITVIAGLVIAYIVLKF